MDIKKFKEEEDGSATIELELTDDDVKALLDYAIRNILDEAVNVRKMCTTKIEDTL